MKRFMYYTVVTLLGCLMWGSSYAADQTDENLKTGFQRFGRGMINLISSPLELPAQMYVRATYQEDRTDNPFSVIGGFLEGIPMGVGYFAWRCAAGMYDITTFPFCACDESIIYPEYLSFSTKFLEQE